MFPAVAIRLFLLSIVSIAAALFIVDRLVVPSLESRGRLAAAQWKQEDLLLMRQNVRKILATNETPWRTRGVSVDRVPHRRHRILVLGDSFTWGDGYANINDLWWRQLERELHRRGFGDVEVVAGAMSGMSTRDELELAKHIVPKLRPDLVIFGYVTNDPEEGLVPYLEMPERDRFEGFLRTFRAVFPDLAALLTDRHRRKMLVKESGEARGYPYPDRELLLLEGANFAKYRGTLREVHDYFAFVNVPAIAVTLPQFPSRSYFAPRLAPVRPAFTAAGIPFFDLLDPFIEAYGDVGNDVAAAMRWGINPANVHPGPRAAHFFADQIATILEERYPAVLGAKWARPVAVPMRVNDWLPYDLQLGVSGEDTIAFDYPSQGDLPRMPVQHAYVQFSFEEPVDVRQIELSGRDLIGADIEITSVDPRNHFDDLTVHSLGWQRGASLVWPLRAVHEARSTSTIRVSAKFRGVDRFVDRHLRLAIIPSGHEHLEPLDFQQPHEEIAGRQPSEGVPHEWRIGGAADFDGDHKPDLVWDNAWSGQVTVATRHADVAVRAHAGDWRVAAVADMDADSHPDLLLRDTKTGQNAIWFLSGRRVSRVEQLPPIGSAWYLGGAADFDGDGRPDLVWRNDDSGEDEVWFMRGAVLLRRVALATIPATASRIRAVADVDGDRQPDLIWRNEESGDVVAWLMRGTTMISSIPIATIPAPDVEIDAAADFNGDGHPDLLWRNVETGDNVVWIMNGTHMMSTLPLPARPDSRHVESPHAPAGVHPPGRGWTLASATDADGDGDEDFLWRNVRTGAYLLRTGRGTSMPFATLDDFRWALRARPERHR